ncbi:sensor histidine kinase [Nocardia fluminea]|uniref:sensor histidine kinase n=1 Tax=Nocardia fluminea TaxID=134984 RepID=UPI0014738D4A|nr:HAMP domain-containing sensor histidine kinase [Nocardia fluminea]
MTAVFVLGAALVAVVLSGSVYGISTGYMESQRARTVERAVRVHAELLRLRLDSTDISGDQALDALDLPSGTMAILHRDTGWSLASADVDFSPGSAPPIPTPAAQITGTATRVRIGDQPYLRAGAAVDNRTVLYEFAPLLELESTLRMLRTILLACSVLAVTIAAAIGAWAAHRALSPLRQVAATASRIASGEHELRLPRTDDEELSTTVDAFNAMVDSLQQRIERERRLVSDLSHELRTPLTTLTTTATVLTGHRDELSERPRAALGLLVEETAYLRGLLDDMLALARVEAGIHRSDQTPLDVAELLTHLLAGHGVAAHVLDIRDAGTIRGRRTELERALVNLLTNAERHGGGVTGVRVDRDGADVVVTVDDAGPGVAPENRERIFERFVTASRSTGGTGIGLALVSETVLGHHGTLRCTESPSGGARFVLTIPALHEIAKNRPEPPQ